MDKSIKDNYKELEMEIIYFETEDVIGDSGGEGDYGSITNGHEMV